MIEIVYNKPKSDTVSKGDIKLPKSVRQVGKGSDMRKIYIEDYVMSYINGLAKKSEDKLMVGVLLGNSMNDGEQYLFIKGAIKVRDFTYNEGRIIFSDKSWSGIYEDIKKYFNTLNIMGWFVILDDIGEYHFGNMKKTHIDNFAGNDKTFFVFETDRGEGSFYFYENGDMVRENGYYVYYERNEDMQEYMIVKEEKAVVNEVAPTVGDGEEVRESKKLLHFMYAVSSFLVVVVLVMAINIMNGSARIGNVENAIDDLSLKFLSGVTYTDPSKPQIVEVKGNVHETLRTEEKETQTETEMETETETEEVTASVESTAKESISKIRLHTVTKGETLASISRKYYGDESKVTEIMSLNAIKDPDKIYLGQVIKLP